MIQTLIALLAALVLVAMSFRANFRFRAQARLPMQWSFNGAVNWSAPRTLALAITPMLGIVVLVAAVAGTLLTEARAGQEGLEGPVVLLLSLAFIGAHGLHLWMIGKTLKRNGS